MRKRHMRVYGLSGKSGTGKSFQAINLCRDMDIDAIIDDGLFVMGNAIIAGISAKRQNTVIGAIKTALFMDDDHKEQVTKSIAERMPGSILILGTSDEMVERIAARLELPALERIINIEEITTKEDRDLARKQRDELGKHVVPVPMPEIKRQFSGYFLDPLRIFKGWGRGRGSFTEKTVVRPTYSYLGAYTVSEAALRDIINAVGKKHKDIIEISRFYTQQDPRGVVIKLSIIVPLGIDAINAISDFQSDVAEKIEAMTAFNIESVDVIVRDFC